jgi:anti-sigma regulatory factor (Ser/Thr protein kinase)
MHHIAESDTTFVLSNDVELLQLLVRHLLNVLHCLPLGDETERLRVGIALEEALVNACYHGNLELAGAGGPADRKRCQHMALARRFEAPYCDRRIHVRARITRSEATFIIRDEGPGFDAARLLPTTLTHGEHGYGRGVLLMRSIMDEVRHNAAGNEVTLVKRAVLPQPAEEDIDAAAPSSNPSKLG